MKQIEGPPLEQLLQRLAETPRAFLDAPRIKRRGKVHVDAVISDLLVSLGGHSLTPESAKAFSTDAKQANRNWLRLCLMAAWTLQDAWFQENPPKTEDILTWLQGDAFRALAGLVKPSQIINDPDRREEFARQTLHALHLQPAGEHAAQAEDRLATLDSVIQKEVLAATRKAVRRAEEIREAMRRKEAERAVPKYSRE